MLWWLWALLWFALLVGAGLVLGLLVRMLWFKVKALTVELNQASARLTAVLAVINESAERDGWVGDDHEQGHRSSARSG